MNWTNPNKFDDYYEESIEQELERLEQRRPHDSGNNRSYDGKPPQEEVWVKPKRDYDD